MKLRSLATWLVMVCAFMALIPLLPLWVCAAILIYPALGGEAFDFTVPTFGESSHAAACPLYPQKQTLRNSVAMSALCAHHRQINHCCGRPALPPQLFVQWTRGYLRPPEAISAKILRLTGCSYTSAAGDSRGAFSHGRPNRAAFFIVRQHD